jgi:ligand-binding sensor domain-containing protein
VDSVIQAIVRLMLVGVLCPPAFGMNPALDINRYAHKAWTVRDGFFKGSIYAIAQTPDGYLWMGTEFGVIRFDGVRSVERQAPNREHLPGGRVRSLLAAHDGRLWIGTDKGLASWNDGKLTQYAELAGKFVLSLLQDHEGTISAAAWGGGKHRRPALHDPRG